jgi:hypothetical protein
VKNYLGESGRRAGVRSWRSAERAKPLFAPIAQPCTDHNLILWCCAQSLIRKLASVTTVAQRALTLCLSLKAASHLVALSADPDLARACQLAVQAPAARYSVDSCTANPHTRPPVHDSFHNSAHALSFHRHLSLAHARRRAAVAYILNSGLCGRSLFTRCALEHQSTPIYARWVVRSSLIFGWLGQRWALCDKKGRKSSR